jgi:hypothetical protein
MKTLVIHPKDKSTDFLKPIYSGLDDVTLVTGDWSQDQILEAIQTHDQVMMMGHGSPGGLFPVGRFPIEKQYGGYVVGSNLVEALSQKDNNIFIWCNADQFVNRHGLKGFYSGMFVSETSEAYYCHVKTFDQTSVDESNDTFARQLGECLGATRAPEEIHAQIREQYGQLAEHNLIAAYNHERLYLN